MEFENLSSSEQLLSDTIKIPDNIVANSVEIKFNSRIRNVFFLNSKISFSDLNKSITFNFPKADDPPTSIPGLIVLSNFITEFEEQEIIKNIDQQKWIKLAHRRVQHYGYEFVYGINSVDKNKKALAEIPFFLDKVTNEINKISKEMGNKENMDQLTINDYMPGDGIPPHFDTHSPFEEIFVALSLGSGITMSFKSSKNEEKHIYIPPRSLTIFSDEARFAWYHSIAQRKVDKVNGKLIFRKRRISLTFRKIKTTPCNCKYPFFCDSQGYDPVNMKKKEDKKRIDQTIKSEEEQKILDESQLNKEHKPTDLEKKFVYDVYDKIAPHFSHTRYKPWPKIEQFLNDLPKGSFIADVGILL